MGILRLGDFLKKSYPHLYNKKQLSAFKGKTYAIDASSTIYSFLVKTITFTNSRVNIPTDSMGNMTGHLLGLLYRVLLCKQIGMNSIWVFDGKPPRHKYQQLSRRRHLKNDARQKVENALDSGDFKQAVSQQKRSVYISQTERQDAFKLIKLLGLPVIQAQSEAEAQCADLVIKGFAEGVISEDIDTLVFKSKSLVKNFNRKQQSIQIKLQQVLSSLELTHQQFIDFSILCGCDYTSKINGIGPIKALKLIKELQSIQKVIDFLNSSQKTRIKHPIPDDFNFLIARKLFNQPEIAQITQTDVTQTALNQLELREFLRQKQFDPKRVENWIQKAKHADLTQKI